jgi:hypothetical protein
MTLLASVAVLALTGLLVWGLVAGGVIGASDSQAAGSGDGDPVPTTAAIVTAPGTGQSEAMAPSGESMASAPPTTTTTTTTPTIDQAVSVTVQNGGVNVPGVAGQTAENLIAAGWTGVDPALTSNAPGFPDVATTQVLYSDPALQATAEALVTSLGIGSAAAADLVADGYTTSLVVILGQDFPV